MLVGMWNNGILISIRASRSMMACKRTIEGNRNDKGDRNDSKSEKLVEIQPPSSSQVCQHNAHVQRSNETYMP